MSPRSRLARAVYRILSFFSSQSYAHIYLSIQDDSQPSVIESHLNELWKMKRATSSKGLSGSVPARCGSASTVEHNHFSAAMEVAVSALATISSLPLAYYLFYIFSIYFRKYVCSGLCERICSQWVHELSNMHLGVYTAVAVSQHPLI